MLLQAKDAEDGQQTTRSRQRDLGQRLPAASDGVNPPDALIFDS